MPHPCVVCGRSRMNPNNRDEDYYFFGFPVNDEIRCKRWLEFCCREDLYKLTKKQLLQRMVCSKHFDPAKDFLNEYLDRLNCTAVPCLYDPKQSLYQICCVLCKKSRKDPPSAKHDGVTYHHFPGEELRCLEWLDFVGVESYYRLTRKEIMFCYICSRHFDASQFVGGFKARLVDDAVPNIKQPSEGKSLAKIEKPSEVRDKDGKVKGLFASPEKLKNKFEPLPQIVLESQACAACGRLRSDPRNKEEKYKFHPFPAYEIGRCLKWCQFMGREDLLKMSPNQIRKLVLCSKHFQAGQCFSKNEPCDAVPTITDESDPLYIQGDVNDSEENDGEKGYRKQIQRAFVSSKKPKVENKPMPLAKKRGRSKRPTLINIPQPDPNNIENRLVRKLPIPSSSNWKIVTNPYQPITIANNATTTTSNLTTTEYKKVILPLTGGITNLGPPIPVHSLSSIPPGLLIKINLPEQQNDGAKRKATVTTGKKTKGRRKAVKIREPLVTPMHQVTTEESMSELITFSSRNTEYETERIEIDEEEYILGETMEIIEPEETEVFVKQEEEQIITKARKRKRRKLTSNARKTIFPITSELKMFLRKVKPHVKKLPKKARAQIKLSIVNMVIDKL